MRPESLYFLFSPITRIKGIGSSTAKALTKLLPQATVVSGATQPIVRDLLFHLPVGIVDRRATYPLREAPDGAVATFVVTVGEHLPPKQKRYGKQPYKVFCSNDTGDITLVFFHAKDDYLKQALPVGARRVISGKVEHYDFQLQMTHPDVIAPVEQLAEVQKPEAVYPLTVGLTSRRIGKIVKDALEKLPDLPEWISVFPPPLRGRVREGGYSHGYEDPAIERAKDLRNNATEFERKLWQYLRGSKNEGYKFRRQQPIGNYIVDFYSADAKLIVELDGRQHDDQQTYDERRTRFLESQGYRVLRFANTDVIKNLEGVYLQISEALRNAPPPSPLPQGEGEYRPSFKTALTLAHNPQSEEELLPLWPARARLAYDEILANQLHLAMLRQHMQRQAGEIIKGTGKLTEALIQSLPFQLTAGQQHALKEISEDMASGHRMGRLLQGDVGSGKTIVALLAMLKAVEQGLQCALMVPTELIAQQHYEVITSLLPPPLRGRVREGGNVKKAPPPNPLPQGEGELVTVLLTGSIKGKMREDVLEKIASGKAGIIIGTHALFQEQVEFKNLALVVVDEQHRFGVEQRTALSAKGNAPHILHMTATPIPRSLTMTLYGDMDCSYLREKPAGRRPITTRVLPVARYNEVVERLKAALDRGEKAYWICPLIEDSGRWTGDSELSTVNGQLSTDLAAAKTRYTEFKARFGDKVGLVHGRMKADARDAEMRKFAEGKTRLLVATTVVEVGVDVRDATIMVVEQAERFGLSQLHQLRGRVGRGEKQSACVLLYSEVDSGQRPATSEDFLLASRQPLAASRLSILRDTEDGFKISEADLAQRGGGDLLGVRQSGWKRFIFTDMGVHQELLATARDDAKQFLKADPDFKTPRGMALTVLLQLFGYE